MLYWNTICLVQNLPPSVFTCSLGTEKYQFFSRKFKIMIGFAIREYKIRLLMFLCNHLRFKTQVICMEYA